MKDTPLWLTQLLHIIGNLELCYGGVWTTNTFNIAVLPYDARYSGCGGNYCSTEPVLID